MVRPSRIGSIGAIQPASSCCRVAGVAIQPVVIGRHVELADAAGNAARLLMLISHSFSRRYWPILPAIAEQRGTGLLDLVERAGQRFFGNLGIVAKRQQHLALALQFLHQVDLEIGAAGDVEDLEQGDQRDVMFLRTLAAQEMTGLVEQILETQQRADALVERIFVGDHAAGPALFWGNSDRILRK